jgi:hypothetical protein
LWNIFTLFKFGHQRNELGKTLMGMLLDPDDLGASITRARRKPSFAASSRPRDRSIPKCLGAWSNKGEPESASR